MLKITKTNLNFVREPLKAPFGFKGGYLNELWQIAVKVESADNYGVGLGVQSVLWSDASVFASSTQSGGNAYMMLLTEYALGLIKNTEFSSPIEMIEEIEDKVYEYAKRITNNSLLRKTFALNGLVALDNAMWQLYGRESETEDFISLIDESSKKYLSGREKMLCNIPLITYNMTVADVKKLVDDGFFFLKIKIGSDPDKDGSREKMLEWDKQRLFEIHQAVRDVKTPYTESGHIPYYLDANGRYDTKERLREFLSYAEEIGALDRIAILEEPFSEDYKEDVSDLPVRIAADESAHSYEDAVERIELGYKAIALKPIAKTMSMSIKILTEAAKRNIPCFCADLTVNPLMVEFNKNVAARISRFPGLKIGVLESNGLQNYTNWEKMKTYHPMYGKASYIEPRNGIFYLDDDFYDISGGIFRDSPYYNDLVK